MSTTPYAIAFFYDFVVWSVRRMVRLVRAYRRLRSAHYQWALSMRAEWLTRPDALALQRQARHRFGYGGPDPYYQSFVRAAENS